MISLIYKFAKNKTVLTEFLRITQNDHSDFNYFFTWLFCNCL